MGARKVSSPQDKPAKRRPAMSDAARENQIIAAAYDLVEERILNKSASPSETVHFLKLGSEKEKMAREKDREEIKLLRAKTEALEAAKESAEIYKEAIKAMRIYTGTFEEE